MARPKKKLSSKVDPAQKIGEVIEASLKPDINEMADQIMEDHQELMVDLDKIETNQKIGDTQSGFFLGSHGISLEELEVVMTSVEKFYKVSGIRFRRGSLTQDSLNILLRDPSFHGHLGSLRRYLNK